MKLIMQLGVGVGLLATFCIASGQTVAAANAPNQGAAASDSSEAAKAAPWLREAAVAESAPAYFGVLGVQTFNDLGTVADNALVTQGPAAFYQNTVATQAAASQIVTKIAKQGPVLQAGGMSTFRDVANLPWGMIEPAAGQYNFSLIDALVQNYQSYNIEFVPVAMPFATWDLATRSAAPAKCQHFFTEDYKYLTFGNKMDRYVNLEAFATMLQTTVERYDGDGVNDMPGLARGVKYWQLQNEPEGSDCGQFNRDVPSWVAFMKRGYEAVKAACPSCQVLNGGGAMFDRTVPVAGDFWWDYASQGGNAYIDVIAIHFNEGKDPVGVQDVALFETKIASAKDALGADKPIWVTEFGVIIGAPVGGPFASFTEAEAASWYTRFYVAGLNSGVKRFFSDSQSFFMTTAGSEVIRRLPYYTNKMLEAKLGAFTASSKLGAGQYRFTTASGAPVYALWSGLPSELSGTVTSYDIYGVETIGNASALTPTQALPLLVLPTAGRPECAISATPATVKAGGPSVLLAACSPAATATAWTAGSGLSDAGGSVAPFFSTTYSMTASNAIGTGAAASVTVTVSDTMTIAAPYANYTVAGSGSDFIVTDKTGATAPQTLSGIKRLRFSDYSLVLDLDGIGGLIYRMYRIALGREPEPEGQGFQMWAYEVHGWTLDMVQQAFLDSPEFANKYGTSTTDEQFISQFYLNILGRVPTAGEASFYLDGMKAKDPRFARNKILGYFADSPENKALMLPSIKNGIKYVSKEGN